jgi:hypothetical protein
VITFLNKKTGELRKKIEQGKPTWICTQVYPFERKTRTRRQRKGTNFSFASWYWGK